LGRICPELFTIMKKTPVSDGEMEGRWAERVWLTVSVTSGRIIIGWRVGT
jgi:hypothetical protein